VSEGLGHATPASPWPPTNTGPHARAPTQRLLRRPHRHSLNNPPPVDRLPATRPKTPCSGARRESGW
jgi:hypothetical protein